MLKLEGTEFDVLSLVHPSVKDAVQKCFSHPSIQGADYFTGKIPSEAVLASGLEPAKLADALIPVAAHFALTPVSDFHVGVVALTSTGDLFFGSNGEIAGGPACFTLHAEECAISNGLCSALETYKPVNVVFKSLSLNAIPCGFCRQLLMEQQQIQNSPIEIRLVKGDTLDVNSRPLDALLPSPFGPNDLKITVFRHEGPLVPPPEAARGDIASPACEALNAAVKVSRAPYSGAFSGAAVEVGLCGGPIFAGACIENAAYNPTTSPFFIAFMKARYAGYALSEISKAVLMEVPGKFTEKQVGELSLKLVAPDAKLYVFNPVKP